MEALKTERAFDRIHFLGVSEISVVLGSNTNLTRSQNFLFLLNWPDCLMKKLNFEESMWPMKFRTEIRLIKLL